MKKDNDERTTKQVAYESQQRASRQFLPIIKLLNEKIKSDYDENIVLESYEFGFTKLLKYKNNRNHCYHYLPPKIKNKISNMTFLIENEKDFDELLKVIKNQLYYAENVKMLEKYTKENLGS
jgi:hypothetical protein